MPRLILQYRKQVEQDIPILHNKLTIGRDPDSDIFIDHQAVSRRHARVVRGPDGFRVVDAGSNNGVFLNSRNNRIKQSSVLKHGDHILIGKHVITYAEHDTIDPNEMISFVGEDDAESDRKRSSTKESQGDKDNKAPSKSWAKPVKVSGLLISLDDKAPNKRYVLDRTESSVGDSPEASVKLPGWNMPETLCIIKRSYDVYHIEPASRWFRPKLNGRSFSTRQQLRDGDVLKLGRYKFMFNQKSK